MRATTLLAFVIFSLLLALAPRIVGAESADPPPPVASAETVRRALLAAQLAIASPEAAAAEVAGAQAAWRAGLAAALDRAVPGASHPVDEALARAAEAARAANAPGLAAARATVWTELLGASYRAALAELRAGRLEAARAWLVLREYRQATRFSRPGADATLALAAAAAGRLAPDAAAAAVTADVLDTYQARLEAALAGVASAADAGFAARRVEHAALARGYFGILAPAFAQQRGGAAAEAARADFGRLVAAAAGDPAGIGPALDAVRARFAGFRAAPLSEAEAARRSGQLQRFLGLVPVEYARGVRGGRVTLDLEVREAITFHAGALAAWNDLAPLLDAQDAAATRAISAELAGLGRQLADAGSGAGVADPDAVLGATEAVLSRYQALAPAAWLRADTGADFDVIRAALDQMQAAAAAGAYDLAESARLEAYAVLEVGPEAKLVAFAPQHKPVLEALFWYGDAERPGLARMIADHAPAAEIAARRRALDTALGEAEQALAGTSAPMAVAVNAAIIVLREGLEAVLILAALLASLKTGATRRYRRPLWAGAALALGATALTWLAFHQTLHALARYGERLEAVVSIIAVAVLLVITNWFFHKAYWVDWLSGFHKKKGEILEAPDARWQATTGLVMLGFTSIYREGFETVLFGQALVLEAGLGVVLAGVAVGLAGVAAVGYLVFALQARLPHRKMMIVTAGLIGLVLVTMVGNTVHILQVVGWLPLTPIRWLALPYWTGLWFGLFPSWEGISLQLAAATFALGSYVLAEHLKHRRVAAAVARARAPIGGTHRPGWE